MRRRFLVAGAFDRYNFGDLLFPRVWSRALKRLGGQTFFEYFSTQAKDLTAVGGVVTRPLDSLLLDPVSREDSLVFAGGEILDAGWAGTYAALSTPRRAFAMKALGRTLGAESVARYLLGSRRTLPWIPSAAEVQEAKVAYWSVGGSGLDQLPKKRRAKIRRNLEEATDLSVRDPLTLEVLESWGIQARLAPDGAVLASEVFPRGELLRALSPGASRILEKLGQGSYLCLQLGRYPSRGHLQVIVGQIATLQRVLPMPILLLPLGQAAAHEDSTALAGIARGLQDRGVTPVISGWETPLPLSVTDTLALIASARLFAGTSLHGNLSALTYRVPRVGLGPRVRKLDLFLRTWDPSQPNGCALFSQLSTRAQEALEIPKLDLESARRRVVEAAWANLRCLLRKLELA